MTATPPPSRDPSAEYGFDEERDPVRDGDSAQAQASGYGTYGYSDHAGAEMSNEPPRSSALVGPDDEQGEEGVRPAPGGQRHDESEQGAGFDQPMEEPQRSASRLSRPK